MKRFVTFNAPGVEPEHFLEGIGPVRSFPGIRSLQILRSTKVSPHYCVILEVDEEKDPEIAAAIEKAKEAFAGFHTGFKTQTFREVFQG